MIALHHFDNTGVTFTDARGRRHRLGTADLLALAQESRDVRTWQRVPGFLRPRGDLAACDAGDGGWRCIFADASCVTIAASRLQTLFAPDPAVVPAHVWRATDPAPPVHDYRAVMAEPAAQLACLRQVLSHGYAHLHHVPNRSGTVTEFLSSFGPVRETNYGTHFDVRVRPSPDNLADSALALLPHTDNPYRTTPPDLQALHALVAAPQGGETWLVDGLAVIAHLRQTAPEALALLAQVPVRFAWADDTWHLTACEPVIALAPDGTLQRLRANSRSIDHPVEPDPDRRAAWWAAWHQLESCLADPAFAQTFMLSAGELVIMDNRRVLHGRTGFAGAAAERHLQGAYADIDGLTSTVFRLAEASAHSAVDALGQVFLSPAMDDRYGETMSIRDHMLRSAELAAARGLGESAVAAALLHDIGWGLGTAVPHERAAADLLRPIFGPAVADPICWHVEAKRYLVTRHPEYRGRLSPASIRTLQQQGGAMDMTECAQFEALPGRERFCAIRLVDDDSKDVAVTRSAWPEYVPMLRRIAMREVLKIAPA